MNRGIPMIDLEEVCLTVDQREAIRLSDLLGMSHEDNAVLGAKKMNFTDSGKRPGEINNST